MAACPHYIATGRTAQETSSTTELLLLRDVIAVANMYLLHHRLATCDVFGGAGACLSAAA
jgi:hypothetical protein